MAEQTTAQTERAEWAAVTLAAALAPDALHPEHAQAVVAGVDHSRRVELLAPSIRRGIERTVKRMGETAAAGEVFREAVRVIGAVRDARTDLDADLSDPLEIPNLTDPAHRAFTALQYLVPATAQIRRRPSLGDPLRTVSDLGDAMNDVHDMSGAEQWAQRLSERALRHAEDQAGVLSAEHVPVLVRDTTWYHIGVVVEDGADYATPDTVTLLSWLPEVCCDSPTHEWSRPTEDRPVIGTEWSGINFDDPLSDCGVHPACYPGSHTRDEYWRPWTCGTCDTAHEPLTTHEPGARSVTDVARAHVRRCDDRAEALNTMRLEQLVEQQHRIGVATAASVPAAYAEAAAAGRVTDVDGAAEVIARAARAAGCIDRGYSGGVSWRIEGPPSRPTLELVGVDADRRCWFDPDYDYHADPIDDADEYVYPDGPWPLNPAHRLETEPYRIPLPPIGPARSSAAAVRGLGACVC